MKPSVNKTSRGIEFILLFFGIPVLIYFYSFVMHPVLLLLPVLVIVLWYFRNKKDINLRTLFNLSVSPAFFWKHIALVLFTGLLMIGYVYFFEREKLFNLPRENTQIWLLFFFLYPLLSAWIQEIIYRTFLFIRYQKLFKKKYLLILASGITFGFAHIVYYHPLSLVLTFIAGMYLAWIYAKTENVFFTSILHAILGNLVFTIGLGHYFWLNMEKYL